jgi:hypothetical protein
LDELNYITVGRVGDNAAAKREWLRAEWERLTRQRQELLAETIQLQASQDVTALRAHAERLARHKEELERRLKELEARDYRGVWASDKRYAKNAMVTFDGSLWIARSDSQSIRPGTSSAWQLAVRKGSDGKDRRDAVQR